MDEIERLTEGVSSVRSPGVNLNWEVVMKTQTSFLVAAICLVLGLITAISLAQSAQDDFSAEDLGAGASLVVTSVSGPAQAYLNQMISVTYTVKNQGSQASGAYQVGLYLSKDKTIDPAADRLLGKVAFATGVAPGISRKTTSKVLIPINGLSGKYYFGAVVANSKKASLKQVSILRYAADDNDTVTDHKTGLMWQRVDDGLQRNWTAAGQYCADLVLGGYTDWRAPTIDQLLTMVDFSRLNPAIDPVFSCHSAYYWSGSTLAEVPDRGWDVYFESGYSSWYYKTDSYYIRCVRGASW
jgi:hypothetical protein